MSATDICQHPIHLGGGASAVVQPAFTGDMSRYEAYASRHADGGAVGTVLSMGDLSTATP